MRKENAMITITHIIYALKAVVAGSLFFVWVVRYQNIVEEFKTYRLPSWLRDLVGIFKLSFALMLFGDDSAIILLGALGISVLMLAAMATHLRVHNTFYKMAPSMSLMVICSLIATLTYQTL